MSPADLKSMFGLFRVLQAAGARPRFRVMVETSLTGGGMAKSCFILSAEGKVMAVDVSQGPVFKARRSQVLVSSAWGSRQWRFI